MVSSSWLASIKCVKSHRFGSKSVFFSFLNSLISTLATAAQVREKFVPGNPQKFAQLLFTERSDKT